MWAVAIIFIAVASCNAELHPKKTAGLPTADSRIRGGTNTTIEKYPFAVQVFDKTTTYRLRCGGSLVSTRHVLSGAHCFVKKNGQQQTPSDYYIRASTPLFDSSGSVHTITAIKIHEKFDFTTRDNDVAVLLMTIPVDMVTSVARPVLFANQDAVVPDNSSVTAIGWGWWSIAADRKKYATFLNEVTVRTVNLKTCQARYMHHVMKVTRNMICAGILDVGGKGSCVGDFGGPLLYQGRVVGLTSFYTSYCGDPKYPTVYTNVARYTKWINDKVNRS